MSKSEKKTVHVVGGYQEYEAMFKNNGWIVVDSVEDADLVQFCGGADVSPSLYGEKPHPTTNTNPDRDRYERGVFELAVAEGCAIAGICRGAQFVHVMNGGKLYQNVDRHALSGVHWAFIDKALFPNFPEKIPVSSTHHQMMRGGKGLCVMNTELSLTRSTGDGPIKEPGKDQEAVFHPDTNSLCYQPHPEFYDKEHPCQKYYFKMINELLFDTEEEK